MDAGRDGGPGDAGRDAAMDGAVEGGIDGALDAGSDAGLDGGRDAGVDAGRDAATDAGPTDAGTDAGDAGGDGEADGAFDAGPPRPAVVFVTSMAYPSSLGGLDGADALCRGLASAAGLAGTFRAILSDSSEDARDRLFIPAEVIDTTGRVVAGSAAELWGGSIRVRIDRDERGMAVTTSILWTGTDADGVADRDPTAGFCGDWTGATGGVEAGRTDATDARWVSIYGAGGSSHACTNMSRLYCLGL
jgi:hypothetical protein